jgi:hypothetical protein
MEPRRADQQQPQLLANPATGEAFYVAFPSSGRRYKWWKAPFIVAEQSARIRLAKLNLSRPAYRIYLLLEGVLDFENWLGVTQAKVAVELEMDPASVSRAFGELEQVGVLQRNRLPGNAQEYRLNPELVWKGSPRRRLQVVSEGGTPIQQQLLEADDSGGTDSVEGTQE